MERTKEYRTQVTRRNILRFQRIRHSILIVCILSVAQVLGLMSIASAEYPGNCTFEKAVSIIWHVDVFPTMPRHFFPTEEDPFTAVICTPTRSIDSTGIYSPDHLSCESKTVTSGEYWGFWNDSERSIRNYYYENGVGWTESDRFHLRPFCPPFNDHYCMNGIGSGMIYFSAEDRVYLDSLPISLPADCDSPPLCTQSYQDKIIECEVEENIKNWDETTCTGECKCNNYNELLAKCGSIENILVTENGACYCKDMNLGNCPPN